MNTLINFIDSISPILAEQKSHLESMLYDKQIGVGENYVEDGQIPRTLAFVQKGLFRYYYCNDEGVEFTKGFLPENSILIYPI